jgi:hypothetical protein
MYDEDRRWLMPQVTEKVWGGDNFGRLHTWLKAGGLGVIKHWAEQYGNYIHEGVHAPITDRKKVLIVDSRSEAQEIAISIAEAICGGEETPVKTPVALGMKDIRRTIESLCNKVFESDAALRKAMKTARAIQLSRRIKIKIRAQDGGKDYVILDYIMYNDALAKLLDGKTSDDQNVLINERNHKARDYLTM